MKKMNTDEIFMILTKVTLFKGMKKWKNVSTVIRSEMTKKTGKVSLPGIMKLKFVILSVRNVMNCPFPDSTGFMRIHPAFALIVTESLMSSFYISGRTIKLL